MASVTEWLIVQMHFSLLPSGIEPNGNKKGKNKTHNSTSKKRLVEETRSGRSKKREELENRREIKALLPD